MTLSVAQWQRVRELFDEATTLAPDEQVAHVHRRAADDPSVQREVERLLELHADPATGPLDAAAREAEHLARSIAADAERPAVVGPWRLDRLIAHGGMGSVFEAHRADQGLEQQHVAIKLIRPELLHSTVVEYFRREQRILAGLSHPGIARFIDGGVTSDGRPFIAMEFVEGEPIDHFCDRHRLTLRQRIELLLPACDAVQYAHRSLVVHRDLKPSNILVTADRQVRLLDFGIAKLLRRDEDGEASPATTTLHALTPAYASPEQIRRAPVTTATDVYSLGSVLYRLLAGRPPWVLDGAPGDFLRIVTDDPRAPSDVVTDDAAAFAGLPGRHRLRAHLSGDLDAIVLRALRREPDQRYGSVLELAEDLGRYLQGRPVIARRGTTAYRLRKFVRRHRIEVGAGAALFVTLVGGIAATTWQASRASAQARLAGAARARAEQVSRFLTAAFSAADPNAEGRDVRVADILDRAAERIDAEMGDLPETAAELRLTLSRTYRGLGLYEEAGDQAVKAVGAATAAVGAHHALTAAAHNELAIVHREAGRYAHAEPHYDQTIDILRGLGDTAAMALAQALNDRAILHNQTGRGDQAERGYREALALWEAGGVDDDRLGAALNNLGVVLGNRGDAVEAEGLHRRALAILRRIHGDGHPQVAWTTYNVAGALDIQRRYGEAEPLYREVLAIWERTLGEGHPQTIMSGSSLASVLYAQDRFAEAEAIARPTAERARQSLSMRHPMTAYAVLMLGQALAGVGRPAEAEPHVRAALASRGSSLGDDHWLVHNTRSILGGILLDQGKRDEAAALLRSSHERLTALMGPDHERTRDAARRLNRLAGSGVP